MIAQLWTRAFAMIKFLSAEHMKIKVSFFIKYACQYNVSEFYHVASDISMYLCVNFWKFDVCSLLFEFKRLLTFNVFHSFIHLKQQHWAFFHSATIDGKVFLLWCLSSIRNCILNVRTWYISLCILRKSEKLLKMNDTIHKTLCHWWKKHWVTEVFDITFTVHFVYNQPFRCD